MMHTIDEGTMNTLYSILMEDDSEVRQRKGVQNEGTDGENSETMMDNLRGRTYTWDAEIDDNFLISDAMDMMHKVPDKPVNAGVTSKLSQITVPLKGEKSPGGAKKTLKVITASASMQKLTEDSLNNSNTAIKSILGNSNSNSNNNINQSLVGAASIIKNNMVATTPLAASISNITLMSPPGSVHGSAVAASPAIPRPPSVLSTASTTGSSAGVAGESKVNLTPMLNGSPSFNNLQAMASTATSNNVVNCSTPATTVATDNSSCSNTNSSVQSNNSYNSTSSITTTANNAMVPPLRKCVSHSTIMPSTSTINSNTNNNNLSPTLAPTATATHLYDGTNNIITNSNTTTIHNTTLPMRMAMTPGSIRTVASYAGNSNTNNGMYHTMMHPTLTRSYSTGIAAAGGAATAGNAPSIHILGLRGGVNGGNVGTGGSNPYLWHTAGMIPAFPPLFHTNASGNLQLSTSNGGNNGTNSMFANSKSLLPQPTMHNNSNNNGTLLGNNNTDSTNTGGLLVQHRSHGELSMLGNSNTGNIVNNTLLSNKLVNNNSAVNSTNTLSLLGNNNSNTPNRQNGGSNGYTNSNNGIILNSGGVLVNNSNYSNNNGNNNNSNNTASSAPKMNNGVYTKEERLLRIQRYQAKKLRRVWKKHIKYDCRKRLAENRPRIKGRFVSRNGSSGALIGLGDCGSGDGSSNENEISVKTEGNNSSVGSSESKISSNNSSNSIVGHGKAGSINGKGSAANKRVSTRSSTKLVDGHPSSSSHGNMVSTSSSASHKTAINRKRGTTSTKEVAGAAHPAIPDSSTSSNSKHHQQAHHQQLCMVDDDDCDDHQFIIIDEEEEEDDDDDDCNDDYPLLLDEDDPMFLHAYNANEDNLLMDASIFNTAHSDVEDDAEVGTDEGRNRRTSPSKRSSNNNSTRRIFNDTALGMPCTTVV